MKRTITFTIIALAASVSLGIYQANEAAKARAEVQTLQQQQARLVEQNQQLQIERDKATNMIAWLTDELEKGKSNNLELLKLRGEVTRLKAMSQVPRNDALALEANFWLDRVSQLKKHLEQDPEKGIPELKFLTPLDWLQAAINPSADDELSVRKALKVLRDTAKARVSPLICDALHNYTKANEGRFPTDIMQLKPYFDTPLDDSILVRFAVVPATEISENRRLWTKPGADWLIAEKAPVDVDFDTRYIIGENGRGISDFDGDSLFQIMRAFEAANKGATLGDFPDLSKLLPYAQTPEQQQALQRVIQRVQSHQKEQ